MSRLSQVEELFFAALEKESVAERTAFLDSACGSDTELRDRVEKLLSAHSRAGDFLVNPVVEQLTAGAERPTPESSGPTNLPPQARFQILRPHARGGLGEVFIARDEELKREVALKEIQERHAHQPESRARFLLEAEITGALEHPGIAPVYGLGAYADGRPFYAMRFIEGDSLKDAIAAFHQAERVGRSASARSLALRQLLGRFIAVCQTIAYAHTRGVLHRDLKPSNIMLGKYGETLVVDWGLAKVLGKADTATIAGAATRSGDSGLTQAGKVMGTPAFMSPEQAQGKLDDLGPTSDVYSLGATLYCLLTGQPPFHEGAVDSVLNRVQRGDFAVPRHVNPRVPAALEAVCLKAMARAPQSRYASARELAEAIEQWLADEPVAAYREPLAARLERWARKRPARTAGIGALLLTGVIALGVSTLLIGQAQNKTSQALRKEEQARKERVQTQLNALGDAAAGAVLGILADLEANRDEVLPRLRQRWQEQGERGKRMRVGLALLPLEPESVRDELASWMLQVEDSAEMLLVRNALKPHAALLAPGLWQKVDAPNTSRQEYFRALVALAAFDAGSPRWQKAAPGLLDELLTANPLYLGSWVRGLQPVRAALQEPLTEMFRSQRPVEERRIAALVLANYAADQPDTLFELLLEANAQQYGLLRPALAKYRTQALARMHAELVRQPDYWKDGSLDPDWQEPTADLRRELEQAGGLLVERFALCQALPLERLVAVTEGLRPSGYRPVRVRPWHEGVTARVAVVWTRDTRDWKLQTGLSLEQTGAAIQVGLVQCDVAGYQTPSGDRYALLWRQDDKDEQAAIYAGVSAAEHARHFDNFRTKHAGFTCRTVQSFPSAEGEGRYSSIWKKSAKAADGSQLTGSSQSQFADLVLAGERLLLDVDVGAAGYATVWQEDSTREATALHGLSTAAHLARCRELASGGWRPAGLTLAPIPGAVGPAVASVWHRPVLPLTEQERWARRQATAAASLLQLGDTKKVWPLLRQQSADPIVRSYLVQQCGLSGVEGRLLVERLEQERDVSARRALILALGEHSGTELPATVREPLVGKLLAWYRDDPDPGIHGAIDWLLRHGKEGPEPRRLDWGQKSALERIDGELADASRKSQLPVNTDRGWFVNGQGQTYTQIQGPVEFRMGALPTEPNRLFAESEKPHVRVIPRNFAVATKPVTVSQWQRFLKERPDVKPKEIEIHSPDAEGPIILVTFYEALQYCNWLSEKESIPREQWCYPEMITPDTKPVPDYLQRGGYRLPTEAEWEYACRAGATTSCYFGSSTELLPRYALFKDNSRQRAWPVGQKRPNDLGLFDMHGNVWAWCQGTSGPYPSGRFEDKGDSRYLIDPGSKCVMRGGSFLSAAQVVRAARRAQNPPVPHGFGAGGLRVCRTYY